MGLRPNRSRSGIEERKADVQGGILQGITTRIAGNGLVCYPIVLLGLKAKRGCQQERGHKD